MSSQNRSSSEATSLLGSSQPARPRERSTFSSETLLIPVAFATSLAAIIPSTTLVDIQRQTVCEFWKITHGDATLPVGDPITPEFCDRPEVVRYFATVIAIIGTAEGIISMALLGILCHILLRCRRKPAILLILVTRMAGNCLIPGSQYAPRWLAGWVFITLFKLFSDLLPCDYLLYLYIVDVCVLEDRTAALSKTAGWGALGTCMGFALGGFITTKTENPFIVFHIAAAIILPTIVYIVFVLPESLPEEQVDRLSRLHPGPSTETLPKIPLLASFLHIFAPLKMFIPTRNWRLTWCGIHMFVYMSAHAYSSSAWLVLATSRYHLTPATTGLFLTSYSLSGAIVLMLILPLLIRFLRPYYTRQIKRPLVLEEEITNMQEVGLEISDRLEVHLAFLSCVCTGIFFLSAAASKTNGVLTLFGICLGFTSIRGPAIRSIVAGSVDPPKQAEALAAIEMVSQAGIVFSSVVMGSILTHTIDTRPLLYFYVHLVVVLLGGALLFLIRDADRYRNPREA